MTVTSSTQPNPASLGVDQGDSTLRVPQKMLGQKDFLKLIATQLTHQDPMKPMEDTTFIAQMANFSSLEQMSQMRSSSDLSFARSLIGQEVTVRDAKTQRNITGVVDGVDVTDKGAAILIEGNPFMIGTVRSVRPYTPPPPATTPNVPTNSLPESNPTPAT